MIALQPTLQLVRNHVQRWFIRTLYLLLINGCTEARSDHEVPGYAAVDTVAFSDPGLAYLNGSYRLNDQPYTGTVTQTLKGYPITTFSSVVDGQLHGVYRSFYPGGDPYEVRSYRYGMSDGVHAGYWEGSGRLKFQYLYREEKKEGIQRNWYPDGTLAYAYHYRDDRLDGLQQAWRENGSLYRNFEVRDGVRYGLQRSQTCYELSDEVLTVQATKSTAK